MLFIGTVYESVSLGEVRFATEPGKSVSLGELVKIEIGGIPQLARIIDISRRNYLIDEDTAVEFSQRVSEDVDLGVESLGITRQFEDHTLGTLEIIGRRTGDHFQGPRTIPKMGTRVYVADQDFLNEQLKSDDTSSVSIGTYIQNQKVPIRLNINELVSKHFSVLAMTGSGKSWTVGVIIEAILSSGIEIPIVVFDPHGEYSSMKIPRNSGAKRVAEKVKTFVVASPEVKSRLDKLFQEKWGVDRESQEIFVDIISLETYQVHHLMTSLYNLTEAQARILHAGWDDIRMNAGMGADCEAILRELHGAAEEVTATASAWNIFSAKFRLLFRHTPFIAHDPSQAIMDLSELVKKGQVSIIDLSGMQEIYQQAFIGVFANEVLNRRIRNSIPPVLLLFEEAHRFIPGAGETASKPALKRIAQEGRKFLVGMGIVSQRPSRVDDDVLSQCNTQFIMRLTNPTDQTYVKKVSENITDSDLNRIRTLSPGEALIFGSAVPLSLPAKIAEKQTQHGGYTPRIRDAMNEW